MTLPIKFRYLPGITDLLYFCKSSMINHVKTVTSHSRQMNYFAERGKKGENSMVY